MPRLSRIWHWYAHQRRWVQVAIGAALLVLVVGPISSALSSNEPDQPAKEAAVSSQPRDPTPTPRPKGYIARVDYGADWPFTVESGVLRCEAAGGNAHLVTFIANDTTYAVNGLARGRRAERNWKDVLDITPQPPTGNVNRVIADAEKLC